MFKSKFRVLEHTSAFKLQKLSNCVCFLSENYCQATLRAITKQEIKICENSRSLSPTGPMSAFIVFITMKENTLSASHRSLALLSTPWPFGDFGAVCGKSLG